MILPLVTISIGLLSAYGVFQYNTNYEGLLENGFTMYKELHENVFSQSNAIIKLVDFLQDTDLSYSYGTQVMLVVGGPGVGKTYSMSIMKKFYKPKELIVNITLPKKRLNEQTLEMTKEAIRWVTKGFSLVIIEGIDIFFLKDVLKFLKQLDQYCHKWNLRAKILLVGEILQVHEELDSAATESFESKEEYTNYIFEISAKAKLFFDENNIKCDVATFMPLTPVEVKQCVKVAISKRVDQTKLTETTINDIVRDVCQGRTDFCLSGCKDVDAYTERTNY
jgi:hypothetical protein